MTPTIEARMLVLLSPVMDALAHPEWTGLAFRYCSWCRTFEGFKAVPAENDGEQTHGICPACAASFKRA